MKTTKRRCERIKWEGGTRVPHWAAQEAEQRATCPAAKTIASYLRARRNIQIPLFQTRIQRTTAMWRATAKSRTEASLWSSARPAASGSTSPAPRSSAPPSQTSGTAHSARPKVQKEERKHGREQRREKMPPTASWAGHLQVWRRSHNKEWEDTLPIIDSGSVLLRVGCLPQYKAPDSWAPSDHPPTFSHECLSSDPMPSPLKIFLAPPRVVLF